MADLGNFDRPILNDKYVDVLDTIRENIKRSKSAADAAQQTANDALAAAGGVDAALGNYMPKSGGRFSGAISTQKINAEVSEALTGLGDGSGVLISSGPWGSNRGASLKLNGVTASDTGFGNNSRWDLNSPGNPSLTGDSVLRWGGNDLGRWASIDPNNRVEKARKINTGAGLTGGGDLSADRTISLSLSQPRDFMLTDVPYSEIPRQVSYTWFDAAPEGIPLGYSVALTTNVGSLRVIQFLGNEYETYHRAYAEGDTPKWRPWRRLWNDYNLANPAQTTGGTFTGKVTFQKSIGILDAGYSQPSGAFDGQVGVAIGDSDSGLLWKSDGFIAFYANNTEQGYWNSTSLYWKGSDLGRWAPIDPGSKVDSQAAKIKGYIDLQAWGNYQEADHTMIHFYTENTQAVFRMGLGSDGSLRFWSYQNDGTYWSSPFSITRDGKVSTEEFHGGAFFARSDSRKKNNFSLIESALSKLDSINGYLYSWIDTGKPAAGLVAQEIEAILPMAVSENEGVKSLDYNAVVALLVNAVRELKSEVLALKGA